PAGRRARRPFGAARGASCTPLTVPFPPSGGQQVGAILTRRRRVGADGAGAGGVPYRKISLLAPCSWSSGSRSVSSPTRHGEDSAMRCGTEEEVRENLRSSRRPLA